MSFSIFRNAMHVGFIDDIQMWRGELSLQRIFDSFNPCGHNTTCPVKALLKYRWSTSKAGHTRA